MEKKVQNFDFEILEKKKINPYITECKIKAFYLEDNRNGSYITPEVGIMLANSIYNAPIVGYYSEEQQDFLGHEVDMKINIETGKIDTAPLTVPFGVVTDRKPYEWEKEVINGRERTYLICYGYLWTGRYKQLNGLVEQGFKGHSMELFEESIKGNWAKVDNFDEEFFIFSEANISALCILGDNVEPCFEGSTVSVTKFTLNDNFQKDFENFLVELDKVLNNNIEGGKELMKDEKLESGVEELCPDCGKPIDECICDKKTNNALDEEKKKKPEEEEKSVEETPKDEEMPKEEEETSKEDEKKIKKEKETFKEDETSTDKKKKRMCELSEEEFSAYEDMKNNYSNLQISYSELKNNFDALEEKYNTISEQYSAIVEQSKSELYEKFEFLGEDNIAKVKEKYNDYSLEDLEDKLSAMAFKLNMKPVTNVVVEIDQNEKINNLPSWLQAVENNNNR